MPDPRGVVAVTVETCAVIINRSGHSTVLQTNEGLKVLSVEYRYMCESREGLLVDQIP